MDWYGNEDDEEALQRGFQGQGALEAIRGDLTLAELEERAGRGRSTRQGHAGPHRAGRRIRPHGSGPAMLGQDPQGNGVPISSDQGAEQVQDARRQGKRRAKSLRSVRITSVGFSSACDFTASPAKNAMSKLLPEPCVCQITPILRSPSGRDASKACRAEQRPIPSRPEAIRRLTAIALDGIPVLVDMIAYLESLTDDAEAQRTADKLRGILERGD